MNYTDLDESPKMIDVSRNGYPSGTGWNWNPNSVGLVGQQNKQAFAVAAAVVVAAVFPSLASVDLKSECVLDS